MMNLTKLTATALIGLSGFAATTANAALISYSQNFSFGSQTISDRETGGSNNAVTSSSASQNLLLSGFNSSLGTLTGVSLAFTSTWSLGSQITASDVFNNELFSEYTSGASQATSSLLVDLLSPAGPDSGLFSNTRASSCSASGSWSSADCSGTSNTNGSFNGSLNLSGLSLASFVNTNLLLQLTRALTAEVTSCDSDSSCVGSNYNNAWSGKITVAYTYNLVKVTEPATWALFALGLTGLLLVRRRALNKR